MILRHRISIRFNSREYGGRKKINKSFSFHSLIFAMNFFYLGLEVQENLIKNTSTIGNTSITQQGQSMSFAPVLGIDRSFGHFNCGLDLKYNLGNYNQEETVQETVVHKVSINGAEVSLSIGYKF